ncbi:MAG: LPS export ABC transporter periplasmic protein LptC, partial [Flavobacteriaceae bacterium]|nr:LPS export ABC transporter periplasmic protein LptC [Flavobacteriaceae bacterium]
LNLILSIATFAMLFFSCKPSIDEVNRLMQLTEEPIGIAENMHLKYTDSGLLKVTLLSPLMKDFSNKAFPFTEFPEGVEVEFYQYDDSLVKKTRVLADYAIRYEENQLVDLRQNVRVETHDGQIFLGDQLFWSPAQRWIFTDVPYTLVRADSSKNRGVRFDADEEFKKILSRKDTIVQFVED